MLAKGLDLQKIESFFVGKKRIVFIGFSFFILKSISKIWIIKSVAGILENQVTTTLFVALPTGIEPISSP